MSDVLIVGGGPTGLLLALELRLAGADPLVLEAADTAERRTRSLGMRSLNGRTMQTLDLRGLVEPLVAAQDTLFDELAATGDVDAVADLVRLARGGRAKGHFAGLPLVEPDDEAAATPRLLLLKQHLLERVLADAARAAGVRLRSGREVVDVRDEGAAVTAVLADGTRYAGGYLVGCDGGRSVVRGRAGFAFPGTEATMTGRTAVATLADPDAVTSSLRGPGGLVNLSLVGGEIATIEFGGGPTERHSPLTAAEMQASVRRASGTDATLTRFETGIRYSDNTRLADTYRRGRVLLAGDAAHVHSPIGGQGLNLGLQDAANLGWKLGLVVRGVAPDALLDTYTAERRPVAARVLRNTRAQVAMMRPGPQVDALREVLGEALTVPATRRHFTAMANGADIDYAPDAADRRVGRFVSAEDVAAAREPLRRGSAVLLDPTRSPEIRAVADAYRVPVVAAGSGGAALLVRPDGYVGWAGDDAEELATTLATMVGVPVGA